MIGRLLVSVMLAIALAGCASSQRELSNVARDWCRTIRASQVQPVYPLSEDVQPGDVFLVSARMEDEVRRYEEEGFLPLDNLVVRLHGLDYAGFYESDFASREQGGPPHQWRGIASSDTGGWSRAPIAAFPAYRFTVRNGAGLDLGVPVQGLAVGLNVLKSRNAEGTLAITDARTYGYEMVALDQLIQDWAAQHRRFLALYAAESDSLCLSGRAGRGGCRYLRVVNRVYLARQINVTLVNATESGGVVAAKPGSAGARVSETTGTPTLSVDSLNAVLRRAAPAPGEGSLKFLTASQRTISLAERFPRPVVVGYIGFDRTILSGGELGPPIPIQARLNRDIGPLGRETTFESDEDSRRLASWLSLPGRRDSLKRVLEREGFPGLAPTVVQYTKEYRALRRYVVCLLGLKQSVPPKGPTE